MVKSKKKEDMMKEQYVKAYRLFREKEGNLTFEDVQPLAISWQAFDAAQASYFRSDAWTVLLWEQMAADAIVHPVCITFS
jgi:hypothetical protein